MMLEAFEKRFDSVPAPRPVEHLSGYGACLLAYPGLLSGTAGVWRARLGTFARGHFEEPPTTETVIDAPHGVDLTPSLAQAIRANDVG